MSKLPEENSNEENESKVNQPLSKPWQKKLGLATGNSLMEFAKFTRLRPIEIYIVAKAILLIKKEIESALHAKTIESDGAKPTFNDKDIAYWMGKHYWKVNPVDKSALESKHRYSQPPTQFELVITDYEIRCDHERASLLVGYERNTATLFTMIHKGNKSAVPTFDEVAFFGFLQDARKFLANKAAKVDIKTVVTLLKDDNSKNINFDVMSITYNNTEGGTFKPDRATPGRGQKGISPIAKKDVKVTIEKIGYKKEVIDTYFKFFQEEDLTVNDLRKWISTYATYINKTLKTIKKHPSQDAWVEEFMKTIRWEVLDRKG